MSFFSDNIGQRHAAASAARSVRSRGGKRVFDLFFAVFSIVFLLPALILIGLALLVIDGRPIIFRHKRVGRNGKTFDCLKFRTMRKDAEKALQDLLASNPARLREWNETQKLKSDPRVHWLGKYLRITSLDELPQLFNVLRGEMSIVGPRPVIAEELERYGSQVHCYLAMSPGITGLWQVSRREDTSYEERVRFDVDYYHSVSLSRDVGIILRTVGVVLFAQNER
ncbi:sugar transferase [Rhizobium cremeum]|uniref:sugar transferase n=1 Tax=Rhizobium cremeum TaxID=2813827 RepID=UPI000DD95D17|nr:sugar transferase [Rhizobium cremeum]MCJ7997686.1 sugar transferase [Rhizobium cremeum]MCJ8002780.1 sugar transferase [Rhizobium cremeum]